MGNRISDLPGDTRGELPVTAPLTGISAAEWCGSSGDPGRVPSGLSGNASGRMIDGMETAERIAIILDAAERALKDPAHTGAGPLLALACREVDDLPASDPEALYLRMRLADLLDKAASLPPRRPWWARFIPRPLRWLASIRQSRDRGDYP